jgi:hypothetical protein
MMKITGDFWETIGPHYVYGYQHPDGSWKYIGKAVGNRVTHHVAEKGYDLEDAFILARNLPNDKVAAAVETVFINQYQPTDNIVSGHHKEKYIMSKLKGLFKNFTDAQRNFHFEKCEFLERYRDAFYSSVGGTTSSGTNFVIWSASRDATQVLIISAKDGLQVQFKVNHATAETASELFEKLRETVEGPLSQDYDLAISPAKTGGIISFMVETEEEAIDLWKDFVS